jgi:hypothetical protein
MVNSKCLESLMMTGFTDDQLKSRLSGKFAELVTLESPAISPWLGIGIMGQELILKSSKAATANAALSWGGMTLQCHEKQYSFCAQAAPLQAGPECIAPKPPIRTGVPPHDATTKLCALKQHQ